MKLKFGVSGAKAPAKSVMGKGLAPTGKGKAPETQPTEGKLKSPQLKHN